MKVIIAGPRHIVDYTLVQQAMQESGIVPSEIVSGNARGVDRLGERWAMDHGVPVIKFIPDWDHHGKSAGFIRNSDMADYADALVAVWDGESRGTKHMIDTAMDLNMAVYIKYVEVKK